MLEIVPEFEEPKSGAREFAEQKSGARDFATPKLSDRDFAAPKVSARDFGAPKSGAREFVEQKSGARLGSPIGSAGDLDHQNSVIQIKNETAHPSISSLFQGRKNRNFLSYLK